MNAKVIILKGVPYEGHKNWIPLIILSSCLGREKLLLQLQNMPLRNDTLRRHNTRNELEAKIGEIDDAIKIFSRPRVFIKQEWKIFVAWNSSSFSERIENIKLLLKS